DPHRIRFPQRRGAYRPRHAQPRWQPTRPTSQRLTHGSSSRACYLYNPASGLIRSSRSWELAVVGARARGSSRSCGLSVVRTRGRADSRRGLAVVATLASGEGAALEPVGPGDDPVAEPVPLVEVPVGAGHVDDVAGAEGVVEPVDVRRPDVDAAMR